MTVEKITQQCCIPCDLNARQAQKENERNMTILKTAGALVITYAALEYGLPALADRVNGILAKEIATKCIPQEINRGVFGQRSDKQLAFCRNVVYPLVKTLGTSKFYLNLAIGNGVFTQIGNALRGTVLKKPIEKT